MVGELIDYEPSAAPLSLWMWKILLGQPIYSENKSDSQHYSMWRNSAVKCANEHLVSGVR